MFAIRQKSTGWWMPPYSGRAGATWVEPTADAIPRLFKTKAQASSSLHWWLSGQVRATYDYNGEWDGDLVYTPVEWRKADDMEVVKVSIHCA